MESAASSVRLPALRADDHASWDRYCDDQPHPVQAKVNIRETHSLVPSGNRVAKQVWTAIGRRLREDVSLCPWNWGW